MVYPRTLKDCGVELGSTPNPTPLSKSVLSIGSSGYVYHQPWLYTPLTIIGVPKFDKSVSKSTKPVIASLLI